jgi:hypothetical protein
VAITNNARLTHPFTTTDSQFGLDLSVSNSVTVDVSSQIDVSTRGYLGGLSGGNNSQSGRTLGNTTVNASTRRNGGSYGGLGRSEMPSKR